MLYLHEYSKHLKNAEAVRGAVNAPHSIQMNDAISSVFAHPQLIDFLLLREWEVGIMGPKINQWLLFPRIYIEFVLNLIPTEFPQNIIMDRWLTARHSFTGIMITNLIVVPLTLVTTSLLSSMHEWKYREHILQFIK